MDIRNILYKSIEQKIEKGTKEYKLFEVDASSAYTIRVYIDSSENKFSFEVNNDSNGANYKIENYAINQNIIIYKNNQSNSDIYYVKFTNNTNFTIRKEIVYGYLTDANTTNDAVAGSPIITLTTSSPKHIFVGNSSFVGDTNISGITNIDGELNANNNVTVNGTANLGDNVSDQIRFNADTTVNGTTNLANLTAKGNVTITGDTHLGNDKSDQINFNEGTTIQGTTSFKQDLTANGNVTITGTTKLGDNASDQINFNESTTVVGTTNLSGEINFNNFYINDFINTPKPGTGQPSGKSKIVFRDNSDDDDSESVEIYGIYNEILKPIVIGNKYSGKVSVLISISNGTLAPEANGGELVLLRLETEDNTPKITYSIIYKNDNISVYRDNVASTVIMDNGNYISNVVTLNFDNNAECKVTSVYKKSDNNSITVYEVAQNIIGGGDSNANASHYLLTAQSLSQILTLSSLSAGATTTNLTKNPQGSINYDGTNQYLLYQSGTNTTELYSAEEDNEQRFIYLQNNQIKNRIGSSESRADTLVIRDSNKNINTDSLTASKNINTGSLTASSVNAEGLNNAGKIIVSGNASTGTLSITGELTSGATTVTGTSTLASLIATGDVTVEGTSQLKSQFIANGNVTVKGAATLGDAASDNINFNATTTIKGTATLGDNASDQINFNAATTVKGTANFKSTLDANGGAVVTGKATLSSLTANGGVDVNGTTNLGDNTSDQIRFNAATTIKGTAFVNGRINFGQVNESDAASIYATNDSTTSGIIFSIADDNDDYFAFRSSHWENGAKDILKLTYTNITAGSNFIPLSNNTYNIGSESNKWKILYVDNINGKFNTSLTIRGNGTDVAAYNGSASKVVNIVAGTNISVLGANGTITIGHEQHSAIVEEARWDENHNNLYIRNVKTDISGHVTDYPEQQVDLYNYYLRSDVDDTKNGSTTFNGPVTVSNIITLAGDKLNTSNGLLSGTPSLGASQGRIYGNAIGFTCPGISTDAGWMRVLGTGESDTVLELATGDDGGGGESIHFRGYTTSGAIGYDVTVPKENGTILTTSSAKIEKTSDELFSITINGKTITFKQTGGEGSALEITCS